MNKPIFQVHTVTVISILSLLCMCFLLSSCRAPTNVQYVEKDNNLYKTKEVHDTLIWSTHDSIYHTVFQKGDTVYDTKYVEKVRYIQKVVETNDTVYEDRIVTEISEKVIEKKVVPKWCYYSLVICVLFVIFASKKVIQWLQAK